MELFLFFFFFSFCVKVTKTCVLLIAVQCSDVRPTLRDVMMMYSQDRYMKNLPKHLVWCSICILYVGIWQCGAHISHYEG